jgi:hypothetical protein
VGVFKNETCQVGWMELRKLRLRVVRVWEHELKEPEKVARKIKEYYET